MSDGFLGLPEADLEQLSRGVAVGSFGMAGLLAGGQIEGGVGTGLQAAGVAGTGFGLFRTVQAFQGATTGESPSEDEADEAKDQVRITEFNPGRGEQFIPGDLWDPLPPFDFDAIGYWSEVRNATTTDLNDVFLGLTVESPRGDRVDFKPNQFSIGGQRVKQVFIRKPLLGGILTRPVALYDPFVEITGAGFDLGNINAGTFDGLFGRWKVIMKVWNRFPSPDTEGLVEMASTGWTPYTVTKTR